MVINTPADGSSVILEPEVIRSRIKNFWGYGNLSGDIWFVGMEEGYNETNEVLAKRFNATAHAQVFDIYEDLRVDPGHVFWFENGAPTQPTYRKLIYLLLYICTGKEPMLEEIRDYQINHFARKDSDHAALELMPLPAKSTRERDWLYADSGAVGLETRKSYLATYKPERVRELRDLIAEHKPKIVIFYSRVYLPDWQLVADAPFEEVISGKLNIAKDHVTLYAVVPHSTAYGISNNDWRAIAEAIRASC